MKVNSKKILLSLSLALIAFSSYGYASNDVVVTVNSSNNITTPNGPALPMPRGGLQINNLPVMPPLTYSPGGVISHQPQPGVMPGGNIGTPPAINPPMGWDTPSARPPLPGDRTNWKPLPLPPGDRTNWKPLPPPSHGGNWKPLPPPSNGNTWKPFPGDRTNWKPVQPGNPGMNCSNGRECFNLPPTISNQLPPALLKGGLSPMPLINTPGATPPPPMVNPGASVQPGNPGMNCSNGRDCVGFPPSINNQLPPALLKGGLSPMPLIDAPAVAPSPLPPMSNPGPATNWQ